MDPWRPDHAGSSRTWQLHAVRYALTAGAVGGWLLDVRPPAPEAAAAAAGLCLLLILDLVVEVCRRSAPAAALLAVQVILALAALRDAASLPLAGVVVALVLGAPRVLPSSWGQVAVGVVPVAAGLRTYTAVDPAAAVYVTAALLAAGRIALWVEEAEKERRRHAETLEELERTQSRLVELVARTRDLAAERERQRILGEIHDTIGHALTATLLQVQVARRLLAGDPDAATKRLAAVEAALRDALQQVRRSLRHAMHPDALPLATALQVLADDVMHAGGPRVELELLPDGTAVSDLDPAVAETVYRAAQEALTNAIRHGAARVVRVRAEATDHRLRLVVADDGAGAGRLVPGLGLSTMTARVQAAGGTVRFRTAPGKGFTVEIGVRRR